MPLSNDLSERELEILILVATGASNKEIAQKLYISTNTVKVHLRNIFAKIEVSSRTEAALYAINTGLVQGPAQVGDEKFSELTEENGTEETEPLEVETPKADKRFRLKNPTIGVLALLFVLALGAAGLFFFMQSNGLASQNLPLPTDSPRWQRMASMPTARMGLALAAYEDQIYAMAGETRSGVTDIVERYDPATNAWKNSSAKPTAVSDVSAAVIGGKFYLPGGSLSTGEVTDVLEIYDPRQDTWTSGASLPVALSAYALAHYEGKLYLFGGWDGKKYLDSVYEYDPGQDRWNPKSPMPSARGYTGAAIVGGKIYVIGGFDGKQALTANEVYVPDLDNGSSQPWSKSKPMPTGRYRMGVASIADIIQVIGGIGEKNKQMLSLEYFPQSDSWQDFGSLGEQTWSDFGIVPLGTHLYIVGGNLDGAPTTQNLSFQAIFTIHIPIVR